MSENAQLSLKPIARTSVSDEIIAQIVDLIARGQLQPGQRLPAERELCKQFGVGRTSLREALRSLAVMGILEGRVGDGTFVSVDNEKYLANAFQLGLLLDHKRVQDLIETRLMLESQTAFWAAQRASQEDLLGLVQALEGMAQTLDQPERYLELDVQFHLGIARATHNTILYSLLGTIRSYLQEWIKGSLAQPSAEMGRRAKLSLEEHQSIVVALNQGQAEAASRAMNEHILSSSVDLQAHLEDRNE